MAGSEATAVAAVGMADPIMLVNALNEDTPLGVPAWTAYCGDTPGVAGR
jgi:hypothetical protein